MTENAAPPADHVTYDQGAGDVERQGDKPAPEHVGFEDTTPADESASDEELTIAEEWAGDYPAGTALFCARFGADEFDEDWGVGDFSDGATVAIQRGTGTPPQGWILRHAHLSDLERTKAILEKHSSPDALTILYSLKDQAFDAFVEAWGKDGGMTPGKSNRSARRSANRKRR